MAEGDARRQVVRRTAPALLVLTLVAGLVVAGAIGWRWRTHPTAFPPSGVFTWGIGEFPVGRSHYAAMVAELDGVGLVRRGFFQKVCPDAVPADGAWFEPSEEHHQDLVMEITPRAEGRVVVSAVEITYTDGWRHGTQVTGGALRAPADR